MTYPVSDDDRAQLDARISETEAYLDLLRLIRDGQIRPVDMESWTARVLRTWNAPRALENR